jgi:hypothetical protein
VGNVSQEVEQRGYIQGDWSTERDETEDEGQMGWEEWRGVERRRIVEWFRFRGS